MLLLRWFDLIRRFNSDCPGFVEAIWIGRHGKFTGPTAQVIAMRSRARNLRSIADAQRMTEEHVRRVLLDAASVARARAARRGP